ncbi:MAG: proprotein convertase P-domain-containing protein [Sumerlaeia bacterium]
MTPRSLLFLNCLLLVLALAPPASALAQRVVAVDRLPSRMAAFTFPLDELETIALAPRDNVALRAEALKLDVLGPYHFADPEPVDVRPSDFGTWETLEDGSLLWRLVVESPGVVSLNFGFTEYTMPKGGSLYLYADGGNQAYGPFTAADNGPHGELWTPVIAGDRGVLELHLPRGSARSVPLRLGTINHGYRELGAALERAAAAFQSGSCNVDVICPEGTAWRDQIRAVGAYSVSGIFACSGTLINNTAQDGRPYFLTADHCDLDAGNDQSVVVYWNYENSLCRPPGSSASGSGGDGPLNMFNSGTIFRAGYGPSDFTLLELEEPVSSAFDPYFAGWSRQDAAPASAVGIHHPNVEEKRISFEDDPTALSAYLGDAGSGTTHIRVADWNLGTTEPGSSGSALFDPNKRIVGQLTGGFAACGNDDPDWYGRIAVSWEGGGTPQTRLKDWLDPLNTGVLTLDGTDLPSLVFASLGPLDDSAGGDGDGVAEPGEAGLAFTVRLVNNASGPVPAFTARLEAVSAQVSVQTAGPIAFPSISGGQTGESLAPYAIRIGEDFACGTPVFLQLVATVSGQPDQVIRFELPTGPVCDFIPHLGVASAALTDSAENGNGNGAADPGETGLSLTLAIENEGRSATNVLATLSTATPSVVVRNATVSYGTIPQGETVLPDAAFVFDLAGDAICGEVVAFSVDLTFDEGGEQFPLALPVGTAREQRLTLPLTFTDVSIGPDPGSVNVPMAVAQDGVLTDLNVQINLTHTFMDDVSITLIHPDGTQVSLIDQRGDSGDNMNGTVFDDEARIAIANGNAPFSGSFRPEGALSSLNGKRLAGQWTLRITDSAFQDGGELLSVEMRPLVRDYECEGPAAPSYAVLDKSTRQPIVSGQVVEFDPLRLRSEDAPPVVFQILNNGGTAIPLDAVEVTPPFSELGSHAGSLAPGEQTEIALILKSTEPGVYEGAMTIPVQANGADAFIVRLRGIAADPKGPVASYSFEGPGASSGWTFVTLPGFFSEPAGFVTTEPVSSLAIQTGDNRTDFGFWHSPWEAVLDDAAASDSLSLIKAEFAVASNAPNRDTVPQFRLRTASRDNERDDVLTLESTGQGVLSPVLGERASTYTVYLEMAEASDVLQAAFDLLNLGGGDASQVTLFLDTVWIARTEVPAAGRLERQWDFTASMDHGWTSNTIEGAFEAPSFASTSQGLSLRTQPTNGQGVVGWWEVPAADRVPIEIGRLYIVEFTVGTDVAVPAEVPAFRMRLNESEFQMSRYTQITSTTDMPVNGPKPTESKTYRVILPPLNESGRELLISFDLLDIAGNGDAANGALFLESVKVFSVEE